MADLRLSSKSQPFVLRKIVGSLALRILLVCLVLLVIPLIFYSLIVYSHEYRVKVRDFFASLEMLASAKRAFLEEVIEGQQKNLQTIGISLEEQSDLQTFFQRVASEENQASLFYQTLLPNGTFFCVASNRQDLLGAADLFINPAKEALHNGSKAFIDIDPINASKQFYVHQPVTQGSVKGVLTIGIPVESLMAKLEKAPHLLGMSLMKKNGEIFFSDKPNTSYDQMKVFSLEDLKDYSLFLKDSEALKNSVRTIPYAVLKVPIEGTSFSLLIDLKEETIRDVQNRDALSKFFILLFSIAGIGGLGTILMTYRMARPLKSLYYLMRRVGEGDLSARFEDDRMGFEINVIGRNFNRMVHALFIHMEEAKNERVAREILANELEIGHEIQRSILPRKMPVFPGIDLGAAFFAAKEVAGDFYDLFEKSDEKGKRLVIAVADASGKGISACLYSLCVRSMLRGFETLSDDLAEIVQLTNRVFCLDTGDTGTFVTAWLGIFDPKTRILTFTCCGHHPAILRRKNGIFEELTSPGMALGVEALAEVYPITVELSSGDILVLYTDGIVETHDTSMQMFGKKRMFEVIEAHQTESAQAIVDAILEEVMSFCASAPLHDDLTVLALKML